MAKDSFTYYGKTFSQNIIFDFMPKLTNNIQAHIDEHPFTHGHTVHEALVFYDSTPIRSILSNIPVKSMVVLHSRNNYTLCVYKNVTQKRGNIFLGVSLYSKKDNVKRVTKLKFASAIKLIYKLDKEFDLSFTSPSNTGLKYTEMEDIIGENELY